MGWTCRVFLGLWVMRFGLVWFIVVGLGKKDGFEFLVFLNGCLF